MRLGWVTCERYPQGFEHEQECLSRLRSAGHEVTPWVWDAPAPQEFELVVVRSPWDYHLKAAAWRAWLDELRVPVLNPKPILRWNSHKSYLFEFEARGVRIVPTVKPTRGQTLKQLANGREAVVKPLVSASAHGTWRVSGSPTPAEEARFQAQLETEELMLQPFAPEVLDPGEWSLVFLERGFSHAVLKRPKGGDFRSQEEHGARIAPAEPPARLLEQARSVLDEVEGRLLYARVDGIWRDGAFYLMELELVDPCLFLEHHPPAAEVLAQAILGYL